MSVPVDWQALAERLGTLTWTDNGRNEWGGSHVACRALCELLGRDVWVSAVEHYIEQAPGSETAKSVLQLLTPPEAMVRCLEVFRSSEDEDRVRWAVNLLPSIADHRVLEWYPEIMAHEDEQVRAGATRIIDQLWIRQVVEPEDAIRLLQPARTDHSNLVRSNAEQIVEMIERDLALERARESRVK